MRGAAPITILRAGLFAALLVPLPALAGGGHHGHGRSFGHGHHHGFGHGHHHADAGHHGRHGLHLGVGGGHGHHGYSFSYGYGGSYRGYSLRYEVRSHTPYSGSHHSAYPAYGYGYGYGGRYGREIYRAPHAYAAPSQPLYAEPAPVALEDLAGWSYLSQGQGERALEIFAAQASGHPGAGAPKVGYALSSALRGRYGRAIWAMRRAFRIDPYGASEVSIDAATRDRLRELVGHDRPGRGDRSSDDAFMRAALYSLLGETQAARRAAERALELGDRDSSVHKLLEMLPRHREPGLPRAHQASEPPYAAVLSSSTLE